MPVIREKKLGRNEPCFCGSGKKYKRCHGAITEGLLPKTSSINHDNEFASKIKEMEALQHQRKQQQGYGREIISVMFKGYKMVAVGNKICYSKKWKTFHDFLMDYIKIALGREWGNAEIKKPFTKRHPILQWYDLVCKYQKATIHKPGEIYSAQMTGAAAAYMNLAYNLYLLAHNAEVEKRLIERLKDPSQFHGAHYETYVAAAFIKAGFDIEFEDETDSSESHTEFTATYRKTNRKFSVEAKARLPGKASAKIGHQLYRALCKKAKYRRVIFIDVNVPDEASNQESVAWLEETLADICNKENSMTIGGKSAPEAYLFVSNHPYQYNLEGTSFRQAVLSEGFKIPDYKIVSRFCNIRDALRAREKHYEMFQLMSSIRTHYEIPCTFDGQIPEFAYGDKSSQRLIIGHRYLVPDSDGTDVEGILTTATVSENERVAYGAYLLDNGRSVIVTCPLTEDELSAYRKYPDTFFGVYQPQGKKINDPIEMFDWLYDIYKHNPKEKLLEFLKHHPDYEQLKSETREELLITCCERWVYSMMNMRSR